MAMVIIPEKKRKSKKGGGGMDIGRPEKTKKIPMSRSMSLIKKEPAIKGYAGGGKVGSPPKSKNKKNATTQKQLDKSAKFKSSVAYQAKNRPKSKLMDYLKDLPGTLSKDISQTNKIRRRASNVAKGEPLAEKKYGTGTRTGTIMDRYLDPTTDGSVESSPKTVRYKGGGKVIKMRGGGSATQGLNYRVR